MAPALSDATLDRLGRGGGVAKIGKRQKERESDGPSPSPRSVPPQSFLHINQQRFSLFAQLPLFQFPPGGGGGGHFLRCLDRADEGGRREEAKTEREREEEMGARR